MEKRDSKGLVLGEGGQTTELKMYQKKVMGRQNTGDIRKNLSHKIKTKKNLKYNFLSIPFTKNIIEKHTDIT